MQNPTSRHEPSHHDEVGDGVSVVQIVRVMSDTHLKLNIIIHKILRRLEAVVLIACCGLIRDLSMSVVREVCMRWSLIRGDEGFNRLQSTEKRKNHKEKMSEVEVSSESHRYGVLLVDLLSCSNSCRADS